MAAPTLVQSTHLEDDNIGHIHITLNGVAAGNLIVLSVGWLTDTADPTCSETTGGSQNLTALTRSTVPSETYYQKLFYLLSATSGNIEYTVTGWSAARYVRVWVAEFNSSGTWELDGSNQNAESMSTSVTTGTINVTGSSNALVFANRLSDVAATVSSPTINGEAVNEFSWSPITTYDHHYYQLRTTTFTGGQGALTYSTNTKWNANLAAFKCVAAGGDLSASISDSIVISEIITRNLPLSKLVFDAMTITEQISRDLPLSTFIYSSITVAESFGEDLPLPSKPIDTVTITDIVNALLELTGVSVSESIIISELIDVDLEGVVADLAKSIYESVPLSEAITVVIRLLPQLTDTVTITETILFNIPLSQIVSDTLGITESIVADMPITMGVSEAISIIESIQATLDVWYTTISDTITISEWIRILLSGVAARRANRGMLLGVYR